jgi:hypothetical protein
MSDVKRYVPVIRDTALGQIIGAELSPIGPWVAIEDYQILASRLDLVEKDRARILADWQNVTSRLSRIRSEVERRRHTDDSSILDEITTLLSSAVVERLDRNCCEWHKAGGDLEYPCNRA